MKTQKMTRALILNRSAKNLAKVRSFIRPVSRRTMLARMRKVRAALTATK